MQILCFNQNTICLFLHIPRLDDVIGHIYILWYNLFIIYCIRNIPSVYILIYIHVTDPNSAHNSLYRQVRDLTVIKHTLTPIYSLMF